MPRILALSGSLRAAASSTAIVRTLARNLEGRATVETFDIRALPHYDADLDPPEPVLALKAAITRADGLIVVTPEYNYSIPGVLKNAIDWASRPAYGSPFRGKPVLVATVSGGALGGVRAQAHLKYVLDGMLARVFTTKEIVVPHAPRKTEGGLLSDPDTEAFLMEAVEAFLASLTTAGA